MKNFNDFELEVTEQERESFHIQDLSALGWAFRKIGALQAKQEEINAYANAEIERIKEWQNSEVGKLGDSIDFFQSHIERFHFNKLMEDPKAKTISTPYGKTKSTTSKPSPKSVDDKALLQHIKTNGFTDYLKVEESVKWGEFKKSILVHERNDELIAVDENGEVIPGVIINPEKTTFKAEVTK